MPKLVGILNRQAAQTAMLRFLIPADIKQGAISWFLDQVEPIEDDIFFDMVDQDISLWHQVIVPSGVDVIWRRNIGDYTDYIKFATQDLILGWVYEARPGLRSVFETQEGKAWFEWNWRQILKELSVT